MSTAKKIGYPSDYSEKVYAKWRDNIDYNKIIVGSKLTPTEVLDFAVSQKYEHIIQEQSPNFQKDLNTAALMLKDRKLYSEYPMAAILDTENVSRTTEKKLELLTFDFNDAKHKGNVLNEVEELLNKKSVTTSLRADVVVIVDELYTNAIFNAPFVNKLNTNVGAPRAGSDVHMEDGKSARIFIGGDSTRLVIGCADPYGSLNVSRLLVRIKGCYDTGVESNMNMSSGGGAGIGSFLVFNHSMSYHLCVVQDKITMVCCTVPLNMSSRQRMGFPKSLHFIIK